MDLAVNTVKFIYRWRWKLKSIMLKSGEKQRNSEKGYSLKVIISKAIYFTLALLISRGSILGSYYPFGMSYFAVASTYQFVPSLLGVILGYILPLRLGSGIRYISTIVSIIAIKWALADLNKIKNHVLYMPTVVFMSSFTTGLAMNCADGINFHSITITLLECLIAASTTYFFDVSFKILSNKKISNVSSKEFVCMVISISVPLISLSEITIHGISIGRVLGIVLTLISAYSLGIIGGAIVGASSGIIFSLSSFGMSYTSASYAFAGMIAGKFISFGRWGICMAFTFVNALISFRSADAFQMISGLYENILATILFLIIPESVIDSFKNIFSSFIYTTKQGVPKALVQRLKLISMSLSSSLECLDKVNLESNSKVNLEEACFDSVKLYCCNCGVKKLCWEKNRKATYNDIREIIKYTYNNREADKLDLPQDTLHTCCKSGEIIKRICDVQRDFSTYSRVKSQTQEFKAIAGNYFEYVNLLLSDIFSDLTKNNTYNERLSLKIEELLRKNQINVLSISCRETKEGRIFIKIETDILEKSKFDGSLLKEISATVGRNLEMPIINLLKNSCLINLFETRKYKVNLFVSQHACNGGKFCGDSCRSFEDGEGNFNVILSDGMGTGSSAAVEGSIVAELIKNFIKFGLGYNESIKLVNTIMLLNTKEESLTALDLVSVDLFKGEIQFIKAGSPATFIIRKGNVEKINFSSLPIGILKNVSISCSKKEVMPGDIILLFSDGVTDMGDEWIMNLIKNIKFDNISEIPKYIVNKTVKARCLNKDDDITALAMEVVEKI